MSGSLELQFMRNPFTGESKQEEFFFLNIRNQCFSGGYGNGKTFIGCAKAYTLLSKFPRYRMAILRASSTDLKRTTMATFFKICPPESYNNGGNRVDSNNYLLLNNGSEVFWMHLEEYDESLVRGLEINSYLIDQAEEVDEKIYLHLDSRLDRWDLADVPDDLDPSRFPKNAGTGKPKPPAYGMILCNPDLKSHWIYRRYHPDSPDHNKVQERVNRITGEKTYFKWSDTHKMIQATSYENPALSQETLREMESRGEQFVKRFIMGEWGNAGGTIHEIHDSSKLYDVPDDLLNKIINRGKIYFALDHGDSAPTCGIWISKYENWLFVFREYYKEKEIISNHRKNIAAINVNEDGIYLNTVNVCDPSMNNKTQQKKGGLFSLIDEYATSEYPAPPIYFTPGDNNEFVTRSRISEALQIRSYIKHPITGVEGASKLYFIMKTPKFPHGCNFVVDQTENQKYVKLGSLNGEDIYGDERDENIDDHAYDALRYNMARIFQFGGTEQSVKAHPNSFREIRKRAIKHQRTYKKLLGILNKR